MGVGCVAVAMFHRCLFGGRLFDGTAVGTRFRKDELATDLLNFNGTIVLDECVVTPGSVSDDPLFSGYVPSVVCARRIHPAVHLPIFRREGNCRSLILDLIENCFNEIESVGSGCWSRGFTESFEEFREARFLGGIGHGWSQFASPENQAMRKFYTSGLFRQRNILTLRGLGVSSPKRGGNTRG